MYFARRFHRNPKRMMRDSAWDYNGVERIPNASLAPNASLT
jgi:hypothetical protein